MQYTLHKQLRALRKRAKLSGTQVSQRAGISQGFYSQLESGDRKLTAEKAQVMARALGVSIAELYGETEEPAVLPRDPAADAGDISSKAPESRDPVPLGSGRLATLRSQIPILSRCPAGSPEAWVIEESNVDEFVPELLSDIPVDRRIIGFRITGLSMAPMILEGDVALVDSDRMAAPGNVAICRLEGEEHTLKLFGRRGKTVRLTPFNPAFPTREYQLEQLEWAIPVVGLYRTDLNIGNMQDVPVLMEKIYQVPGLLDLCQHLVTVPEGLREALRAAMAKTDQKGDTYRWMSRMLRNAQVELDEIAEE